MSFGHRVVASVKSMLIQSLAPSSNVLFLFSDGAMLRMMVRPLVRGVRGVVMWEAEV